MPLINNKPIPKHFENHFNLGINLGENCPVYFENHMDIFNDKTIKDKDGYNSDLFVNEMTKGKGICAGITAAWISSVLSRNDEATNCSLFPSFFLNSLRGQGTHLQALSINHKAVDVCLTRYNIHHNNPDLIMESFSKDIKKKTPDEIKSALVNMYRSKTGTWAAMVCGDWHAIGIAVVEDFVCNKYFIMDPNYGLLEYNCIDLVITDLYGYIVKCIESFEKFKIQLGALSDEDAATKMAASRAKTLSIKKELFESKKKNLTKKNINGRK